VRSSGNADTSRDRSETPPGRSERPFRSVNRSFRPLKALKSHPRHHRAEFFALCRQFLDHDDPMPLEPFAIALKPTDVKAGAML
jgi:hypothetical protein